MCRQLGRVRGVAQVMDALQREQAESEALQGWIKRNAELTAGLEAARARISALERDNGRLQADKAILEKNIEKLKEMLENEQDRAWNMAGAVSSLDTKKNILMQRLKHSENEISELEKRDEVLCNGLSALWKHAQNMEKHILKHEGFVPAELAMYPQEAIEATEHFWRGAK